MRDYKKPEIGKLVFGNDWNLNELEKLNVNSDSKFDFSNYNTEEILSSGKISKIEDDFTYNIDPENGNNFFKNQIVGGYDESFLTFESLEGQARAISHSYVFGKEGKYIPNNYLTFNIYTKSKLLIEKNSENNKIRLVEGKISEAITQDYMIERQYFLEEIVPNNSYLFIDGPLFSGAQTAANFNLIDNLMSKNIIPIFLKKGCNSDIIVSEFDWANKYNSDIHWANSSLKEKQRTCFFKYESDDVVKRSKVFCYLKVYHRNSPVRIEIDERTFSIVKKEINNIIDLITYLYYVDGNLTSPQVRQIAIAEKYARETLIVTNIYKTISKYGLTPTQNQVRF